jgi:hypothetical protein
MTPIIAGSVCGGVMAIAYIVGFTIYFVKRRRRKERKRKLAASGHDLTPLTLPTTPTTPTTKKNKKPEEKIIVPPDPAIVLGLRRPGENAFGEPADNSANSPPPTSDITSAVIVS